MQKGIKTYFGYIVFAVTVIFLVGYRIQFCINAGDEALLLSLTKKIALGQKPFFDLWELYQTGSIFLAPFFWIFIKITGGTNGIVLYCRIIYLILNCLLMVVCYLELSCKMGKRYAFYMGMVIIGFAPFSLYYLWYDTANIYFAILGMCFLISGMLETEKKGR